MYCLLMPTILSAEILAQQKKNWKNFQVTEMQNTENEDHDYAILAATASQRSENLEDKLTLCPTLSYSTSDKLPMCKYLPLQLKFYLLEKENFFFVNNNVFV